MFARALQPANDEPVFALAFNVIVASLLEVAMEVQVLVTVCDAAAPPVPPHAVRAFTVPALAVIVTEPLPVPANVRSQLRAAAT